MTMPTAPITGTNPIWVSSTIDAAMPANWTHGYSGDLNRGRYHATLLSRKAMTAMFTIESTSSWKALASLANSNSGTKAMSASSAIPVTAIDTIGVPERAPMVANRRGAKRLRAIANG